jgi:hypothetical protein
MTAAESLEDKRWDLPTAPYEIRTKASGAHYRNEMGVLSPRGFTDEDNDSLAGGWQLCEV